MSPAGSTGGKYGVVRKFFTLLVSDPRRLFRAAKVRLAGVETALSKNSPARSKKFYALKVNHSLPDQIAALSRLGAESIVTYGDQAFAAEVNHALSESPLSETTLEWASSTFDDQQAGAKRPDQIDWAECDAVLIGGPLLPHAYRHAIALMADAAVAKPIFWVGDGFEFCGGSLPVPAEAEDAEVYLFQHFEQYFGVKQPLMVKIELRDSRTSRVEWRILRPGSTLRLVLSEMLPDRAGPAVFLVRTEHPELTRGRHNRWRFTADIHWRSSLTTLHGGHDFRGPQAKNSFRLNTALIDHGELVVTLPNYNQDCPPEAATVNVTAPIDLARAVPSRFERDPALPIDQLTVTLPPDADAGAPTAQEQRLLHYQYQGYGGSFWFGFETNDTAAGGSTILANHTLGFRRFDDDVSLTAEKRARLESVLAAGYRVHPYPVPITRPQDSLLFGFCFDTADPHIPHYVLDIYNSDGRLIANCGYDAPISGVVDSDQILASIGRSGQSTQADEAGMFIVRPDWLRCDIDPAKARFFGDLVVRNRSSGDHDRTEFQSCWRNLGTDVPEYPHWIHPSRSVSGTTNLMGRVLHRDGVRSGVLLVNASGYQEYGTTANAEISVLSPDGRTEAAECTVAAFTSRLIWLDELFFDLSAHLSEGFGTMLVQSRDADINCQMVTSTAEGAVSLQHMWGY